MNTRDIAVIALKILAMYIFLQFLMAMPMVLSFGQKISAMGNAYQTDPEIGQGIVFMAISLAVITLVWLVSACFLFFGARRISIFFVENPKDTLVTSHTISDQFMKAIFQCIGVYAIVEWTPDLVQTIFRTIIYGTWQTPQTPFLRRVYENWSVLIGPTTGTVIGLVLIFKARGILRLIQGVRTLPHERPELEETPK